MLFVPRLVNAIYSSITKCFESDIFRKDQLMSNPWHLSLVPSDSSISHCVICVSLWRLQSFRGCVCVFTKLLQSCPTLCDPVDCSPPGSSVHGISQAGILERVAIPFSKGSSWSRDGTWVSHTLGTFFTIWATREAESQTAEVQILALPLPL